MTTLVIADCTGTDNDNDKFIVIMVIVIYCQRTKMIVMIGMLIMIMRIIRKKYVALLGIIAK